MSPYLPRAFRGDLCYSNRQGSCETCGDPTGSPAYAYCPRCLRERAAERVRREARDAARRAAPPSPSMPTVTEDGWPF